MAKHHAAKGGTSSNGPHDRARAASRNAKRPKSEDPQVPSQMDSTPPIDDGPVTRAQFEAFRADVMKELAGKANASSLAGYQKKASKKAAKKSAER